jgi:hypothetical protein
MRQYGFDYVMPPLCWPERGSDGARGGWGGGGGYLGCGACMNECTAREQGTLLLKMSSLLKHKRVRAHTLFCAESHTCVDILHKYTWFLIYVYHVT